MLLPFTPTTGFGRNDAVRLMLVATWRQITTSSIENIYRPYRTRGWRAPPDQPWPSFMNRERQGERTLRVFINLSRTFSFRSSIQPVDTGRFASACASRARANLIPAGSGDARIHHNQDSIAQIFWIIKRNSHLPQKKYSLDGNLDRR
jgi:hypothetical protein